MKSVRLAAAMTVLLLAARPACAQQWAFGGTGEDRLSEIVAAQDGFFAAGTTASDDYDLDMRTRRGDAGWAMRLDAAGEATFHFVSARSGMTRMTAPAAFEDGTYSLVLTDAAAQRGEWILLDARGEQTARTAIPACAALCPQATEILQMLPVMTDGGAHLALLLRHGEGERCLALLAPDGSVRAGAPFPAGEGGRAAAAFGGEAAHACLAGDAVRIHALQAGGEVIAVIDVPAPQGVQTIDDLLLGSDLSAALCGETARGGYLMRVSRAGEVLFALETDAPLRALTATDTGFAALEDGRVLFLDEDGAQTAWADAPQDALDLAAAPDGAAALTHLDARGRRQAVITRVAQPTWTAQRAEPDTQEGLLLVRGGYLLCSAEAAHGVRVRWVGEDGAERFCVLTPIHTAADALEWLSACTLTDGSILLGGRYLYGEGEAARQQGVIAKLSADGVLRRMETIPDVGAVCSILPDSQGRATLSVSGSESASLVADETVEIAL